MKPYITHHTARKSGGGGGGGGWLQLMIGIAVGQDTCIKYICFQLSNYGLV